MHDRGEVIIRNARISDIDAIKRVEDRSFKYPYSKSFLLYLLNISDAFYVATIDSPDKIVGYICGSVEGDRGHIISIAVDPSYRRRGIGKLLMERIMSFYRERGIRRVYLECRVSNRVAQRFYEALGFRRKCIVKQYYENGEDAIVYIKDLV